MLKLCKEIYFIKKFGLNSKTIESERLLTYNACLKNNVFGRFMGRFVNKLNKKIKAQDKSYERQLFQSYLTAPEWRNVEIANELGDFLKRGNPFYRYPYFKQIQDFWTIFRQSYLAARKHHGAMQLITSEYMVMNVFIGLFTTIGFFSKGLLSVILAPFLPRRRQSEFQRDVGNLIKEYAEFIQHTPFYNFSYTSKLPNVWQSFKQTNNKSLADVIAFGFVAMELIVRQLISAPIAWWYSQPQNTVADTIRILVKTNAKEQNFNRLDKRIQTISRHIRTKDNHSHYYYDLAVPRYNNFQNIVEQFNKNHILIRKIAGQDRIQVKIESKPKQSLTSYQVLYRYQNHINPKIFTELDVETKDFNQTLRKLRRQKIKIKTIHDF